MVYNLLPQLSRHCVLCGTSARRDLCPDCDAEFPRIDSSCRHCGIPFAHEGLCGDCLIAPPIFSRCIAALRYEPPISHLIGSFKYQGNFNYGRILSQVLIDRLKSEEIQSISALIPVPLHWRRRWQRGFNQSEIIADELSRTLLLPMQTHWLRKTHRGTPQQQLNADARQRNLLGAFSCGRDVTGMHLAVVDDVVTTGATANAIARTLRDHGAASVQIWTLARTP
jgi:ComF family protein